MSHNKWWCCRTIQTAHVCWRQRPGN